MPYEEDSSRSWARAVEPINKAGYMDGAADGQESTFQSSFDIGYKQGINFGIQIGFSEAVNRRDIINQEFNDARRINCQLCLNYTAQDKVDNLFNFQEEKNNEYKLCNKS